METIAPVPETIYCETNKEGLIITGLGNFPYEIDRNKLTRHESVEQMKARLGDDDPSRPVMSGECWSEGCDTVILRLTPLLCRVRLTRVDNLIGGNTLLEEPLISLKGAMTEAELMRHSGFRPVSNIEGEISVKLGNDIGSAPVFPDVSLYCYPYDDAGQEVGCPPVMMCFSCTVDGEVLEWSFGLPPLRRDSTLEVSLTIEGKDKFSYCCQ